MASKKRYRALTLLVVLLLAATSGLASPGVLEIDGVMRVHIRPAPTAQLSAGPLGGPYVAGPFTIPEGTAIEFTACCISDPTGGVLTLEWDFDYDGAQFTTDATGPGPHTRAYSDGPMTRTIALRLSSSSGVTLIQTQTLTVLNVAPVADPGGPYTVVRGSPLVTYGAASDPSPVDGSAGLLYEWDFDYTGTFQPELGGIGLHSATSTYVVSGDWTLALRVTDKDGASSAVATTTVTVVGPTHTVALQSAADTYVDKGDPSGSFGTGPQLYVQSRSGLDRRSLVRFDLGTIPAGSTVQSATLRLYAATPASTSRTYNTHRVLSPWTETTTWTNQPPVATTATAAATTPTAAGWMSWDVAADVQEIVAGTASNYGWRVADSVEGEGSTRVTTFQSREFSDGSLRPTIVITYQEP